MTEVDEQARSAYESDQYPNNQKKVRAGIVNSKNRVKEKKAPRIPKLNKESVKAAEKSKKDEFSHVKDMLSEKIRD